MKRCLLLGSNWSSSPNGVCGSPSKLPNRAAKKKLFEQAARSMVDAVNWRLLRTGSRKSTRVSDVKTRSPKKETSIERIKVVKFVGI